jgi:hypothetical protein
MGQFDPHGDLNYNVERSGLVAIARYMSEPII